jgi:hypothetical protein
MAATFDAAAQRARTLALRAYLRQVFPRFHDKAAVSARSTAQELRQTVSRLSCATGKGVRAPLPQARIRRIAPQPGRFVDELCGA